MQWIKRSYKGRMNALDPTEVNGDSSSTYLHWNTFRRLKCRPFRPIQMYVHNKRENILIKVMDVLGQTEV